MHRNIQRVVAYGEGVMIVGQLFRARHQSTQLDQLILICIPAVITSIVLYGLYYYLQGVWQSLAVAGGGFLALAGLGLSLLLSRRRKAELAARIMVYSLLAVFGVVPLFIEGLTLYIVLSAGVLITVVGAGILPGRWRTWLVTAALFGLYAWLVDWWAPLPRYALGPSSLPRLYLFGASATILAVILWYATLAALRSFTSIGTRLIITFLLLVLFTGGAITYFSLIVLTYREQIHVIGTLNTVAIAKARQAEDWSDRLQAALAQFVHDTRPQLTSLLLAKASGQASHASPQQYLHEELEDISLQMRLYDTLYVIDASGNLILSTGHLGGTRLPVEAACLQQALKGPCLDPPRYYPSLGRFAVVTGQPIVDQEGHPLGIVAGDAGLEELDKIAEEVAGLGNTSTIYMVGLDHTVLTPAGRQTIALSPGGAAGSTGIEMALAQGISSSGFYQGYHGLPVVGAYRWLPKLQIGLAAEQEQAQAFEASTMHNVVHLSVMLILLLTAAMTALYIVRDITAPLGHLAATAEQIADGALDLSVAVGPDDEIGALARAFNHMTSRLRQTMDQLEQRVRQRTEELSQANSELQAENVVRRRAEQAVQLERNKLKSILDAMDDGVYIVNQHYDIEYANPVLEREFGTLDSRKCYAYLYNRTDVCPWCPNATVWQGLSVRREHTFADGKTYELFDTPLANADGTLAKLALFHDITARRQAEDEILQRNRELAILSRRLVEIQESERQYISRELHDETGQALTALMLRLGLLERELQRGLPVADRVAELKQTVEEVLEGLHGLAMDLRPSSLDHVGLAAALRQYAERIIDRYGLAVDFATIGLDEERLPAPMEITIYRIVQEALVNVVRHAQATRADVIVERRGDRVRVVIEDNGVGFDAAVVMYSGRLGLLGMRERAEMIGGRLVVDSAPGAGTTVLVEAPYDGSHPDR